MTAAARQAPGSRPWSAWIPRDRVDARHNPAFARASDRQRVLLLALEFLWKSRPYAFASNAELADLTGWGLRKVQRTLEELQSDGLIHREFVTGRTDRVTGRVAIIALARLSDQPVATRGLDLDQILAAIRLDLGRRHPPTVPFDRPMDARQNCHRVHDISDAGRTTDLSSPLMKKREIQVNTTTTGEDAGPAPSEMREPDRSSSSLSLLSEPEPEGDGSHDTEASGAVLIPRESAAQPSPAPIVAPPAPAAEPVAVAPPPAELVAAAAEALPGASREWLAGLLRDCGAYGLDLALLVMAWVKLRRPQKPARYAGVALSGWLSKLRSGAMTLEDVRSEVKGGTGPPGTRRPFDPTACLARMACEGWALVPVGPDRVKWTEMADRDAGLWKHIPSDLRQQLEEYKSELKAYVLERASERGKAVALRA